MNYKMQERLKSRFRNHELIGWIVAKIDPKDMSRELLFLLVDLCGRIDKEKLEKIINSSPLNYDELLKYKVALESIDNTKVRK